MSEPLGDRPPSQTEGRETSEATAEMPTRGRLVAVTLVFEGALALLALGLGWLLDVPIWSQMKFDVDALTWGVALSAPPVAALLLLDRYPIGRFRQLKQYVEEHVSPIFRGCSVWQFMAIAAMAGLGEELLCRGFLQNGLQIWLTDHLGTSAATWVALILASAAFGAAHAMTRDYAVACFVIGLYLGGIWIAGENLLVPVIIHGIYDFVALMYLARRRSNPDLGNAG